MVIFKEFTLLVWLTILSRYNVESHVRAQQSDLSYTDSLSEHESLTSAEVAYIRKQLRQREKQKESWDEEMNLEDDAEGRRLRQMFGDVTTVPTTPQPKDLRVTMLRALLKGFRRRQQGSYVMLVRPFGGFNISITPCLRMTFKEIIERDKRQTGTSRFEKVLLHGKLNHVMKDENDFEYAGYFVKKYATRREITWEYELDIHIRDGELFHFSITYLEWGQSGKSGHRCVFVKDGVALK